MFRKRKKSRKQHRHAHQDSCLCKVATAIIMLVHLIDTLLRSYFSR